MKRRIAVLAGAVAVLAGGMAAAGYAVSAAGHNAHQSPASTLPAPATAKVERGDLSDTVQVDATIGYPPDRTLHAGASGTVTWTAKAGSTITRDGVVYKVDEKPTRAWYGTVPMYRTLRRGDKGNDVKMLEQNLQALGYGSGLTVDNDFTAATARAVKRWQQHHNLIETGTLGTDQIVIIAGTVRIKTVAVQVGDHAQEGEPILTASGVGNVVRFQLDAGRGTLAKVGAPVTVDLPTGDTAKATINWVSPVAEKGKEEGADPTITVTATMRAPNKTALIDESPATVRLTSETRRNVLSVPVNALLALPGSGFGVELVQNGATRDLPVKVGLFSDGRVEVSGAGLAEGATVGVPAS